MCTFEELQTLLVEIEGLLNSRPLTSVKTDPEELSCLTPAHFYLGEKITNLPDSNCPDGPHIPLSSSTGLTKRWRNSQQLLNSFWRRWTHEYILTLRTLHQSKHNKHTKPLAIGDLVLVKDLNHPRLLWPLGRIVDAHVGRDRLVRSYTVKLASRKPVVRAVQMLCPLEANIS